MMERVYECEADKANELKKLLEADPYSEDSFARAGYKLKDGSMVGEDKDKVYLYISAGEDFLKKADELLKDLAKPANDEVAARVITKIKEEESTVASGVAMFGD
jgi:hypothetical protein